MSKSRRNLASVKVALSCALCLAAVGGWIWSYFDRVYLPSTGAFSLCLSRGRITFYQFGWLTRSPPLVLIVWDESYAGFGPGGTLGPPQDFIDAPRASNGFGFGYGHIDVGPRATYSNEAFTVHCVACPSWFLVVMLLSLTLHQGLQLRRDSPKPKGFCATCGYDLRATPDRCPECGTVVAKSVEKRRIYRSILKVALR